MLREFCGDILRATAFLSRLPVPARFFEGHDGRMGGLAGAFALSGLLLSLPAALLAALLIAGDAPPLLSAFLVLGLQTLVTGALHEDGFADCADGLGGGRDRDRALAIMKDSRIGAYGVIALVLGFGLRASALSALMDVATPLFVALAFLLAQAVSRAAMAWHWQALPSARPGGVADSAGLPEHGSVLVCIGTVLLAALVFVVLDLPLLPVVVAVLLAGVVTAGFSRFVRRKIGGHTGDTIGATQQLAEMAVLVALALMA